MAFITDSLSRRDFLHHSGAGLGGAAWLALRLPALQAVALAACRDADQGQPFRVLTAEAAREIEAVAARIIPSDDGTPGAREAGVIRFIDRALEGFAGWARESVESGVADLAAASRARDERFSELAAADQDAVLAGIEDGDFFQNVRLLTILGMFADPRHGGNRDKSGWNLLGYVDRPAWQPPFGWYDERYTADRREVT